MTPARTHQLAQKGRMGSMDLPFEGGCFTSRGPGPVQSYQWVAACLGRMGSMGRMKRLLSLGKVFGAVLKPFSVCGRKSSSLSSPSSLNGLQAFEIKRCAAKALAEIILPTFGVILPILPFCRMAIQPMAAVAVKTTRY